MGCREDFYFGSQISVGWSDSTAGRELVLYVGDVQGFDPWHPISSPELARIVIPEHSGVWPPNKNSLAARRVFRGLEHKHAAFLASVLSRSESPEHCWWVCPQNKMKQKNPKTQKGQNRPYMMPQKNHWGH